MFSGKCPPDGNPCTQICFNIHNNMYECGCKNGFILSADGYNCILQEGKLEIECQHINVYKYIIFIDSFVSKYVKAVPNPVEFICLFIHWFLSTNVDINSIARIILFSLTSFIVHLIATCRSWNKIATFKESENIKEMVWNWNRTLSVSQVACFVLYGSFFKTIFYGK